MSVSEDYSGTARPAQHDDGRGQHRNPERRIGADGAATMDIAFRLPLAARLKLEALRNDQDAENALVRRLSERRIRLWQTKTAIEDELSSLLTPRNGIARNGHSGRGMAENAAEVLDCRAQLADVAESLKKNAEDVRAARGTSNVTALENYVRGLHPGAITLFDAKSAFVLPERNEAIQDAIEKVRAKRRKLLDELQKASDAPIHSTEAKRLVRERLASLFERGRPDLFDVIERGGPIKWPSQERPPIMYGGNYASPRPAEFDALACFAWLNQKSLASALDLEIEKIADDKEAMSEEQRQKVQAKLRENLLSAEYDEEALVAVAIERGLRVTRRPDADPRAVLGLSQDMPPPERRMGVGAV